MPMLKIHSDRGTREAKQAIWLTPADIKEQYRNASILKIIELYSISQGISID
jgi:hypothetical protein